MSLEELGSKPEAGFAGAGRADDTAIQISGVGRIFWARVHGKKFRPGENDVILKLGIDKGFYILFRSKTGGAILLIAAVLFSIFAFRVDQQTERRRAHNTNEPVKGNEPRSKVGKGRADGLAQPHELMSNIRTRRQPVGRPQFQTGPQDKQIGDVGYQILFEFICPHGPPPLLVLSSGAFPLQADPQPV